MQTDNFKQAAPAVTTQSARQAIDTALATLTDTQADPATYSEESQRAIENLHRAGEYLDNLAKRLSTN